MRYNCIFLCGCCFLVILTTVTIVYETKRLIFLRQLYGQENERDLLDINNENTDIGLNANNNQYNENDNENNNNTMNISSSLYNVRNLAYDLKSLATDLFFATNHSDTLQYYNWYESFFNVTKRRKREIIEIDKMGNRVYNVGVLMASHLGK